jgi:Flp pilus assembly protein TadG
MVSSAAALASGVIAASVAALLAGAIAVNAAEAAAGDSASIAPPLSAIDMDVNAAEAAAAPIDEISGKAPGAVVGACVTSTVAVAIAAVEAAASTVALASAEPTGASAAIAVPRVPDVTDVVNSLAISDARLPMPLATSGGTEMSNTILDAVAGVNGSHLTFDSIVASLTVPMLGVETIESLKAAFEASSKPSHPIPSSTTSLAMIDGTGTGAGVGTAAAAPAASPPPPPDATRLAHAPQVYLQRS